MNKKILVKDIIDVGHVNNMIASSKPEFISDCENKYFNQVSRIALYTAEKMQGKILLLSGPSASTKTTTANKLAAELNNMGVKSVVISLDNFFLNRDDLPTLADGSPDFESINTLDLVTMDSCFEQLLNSGKSVFPIFDFHSGKRSENSMEITVDENSVVIIEGIHALHPKITSKHNKENFLKLYITPHSNYYLNGEMLLSTRNLRLIRRIIRDNYHRHSGPSNTLDMWVNVVNSEIENIIPFKEGADFLIDSTVDYEANVYAAIFGQIVAQSTILPRHQEKINELKAALEKFVPIAIEDIPNDTVIKEFLI